MGTVESKKLALLRILDIFKKHSDFDHRLKQEDIAYLLEKDYGIVIERKAISRKISLLKEAGYVIISDRHGSYLEEREFDNSELRMLIDGVLSSRHITAKYSKDLIEKLCGLSNRFFRSHVKNIHSVNEWSKTDNQALFYNIELIDDAIEKERQIEFDYNKYGTDRKLHKTTTHKASPYQLILHNQRYYLMALNERWHNMAYYRVDRITNMTISDLRLTPIKTVEGYENGINYSELATSLPYMFTDKLEKITFYTNEVIVDQIVDWFGDNAKFERAQDKLKVTVKASPSAMEFWAMQYLNFVEIISPVHLRDRIKENLKNATDKYT